MRIGVVTTSYPRRPGDAAGSFVAAHVDAMRALGHDVDVLAAHHLGSHLFDGAGAPEELERRGGYLEAMRFTARLGVEVVRRARAWDLIVAHWLVPCALAAVAARKPLVAIAHGGDVHTLRRLHLLRPALRLLGNARLAFVSEELRAIANRPDAIVQPMGIDVPHFARLPRTPSSPPTILVVARLVPIKGVDVAIAALPHMQTRARLVIAGDGPERSRLEDAGSTSLGGVDAGITSVGGVDAGGMSLGGIGASATSLGGVDASGTSLGGIGAGATSLGGVDAGGTSLGGIKITSRARADASVTFLGAVDARTRDELLAQASVVVVPSRVLANGRSEGMPMIALEALAAGVPLVASAVGGLTELTGADRVRPDDPRALAAAIDRVLASPPSAAELRASVAALDWSRVAVRLLQHASCEVRDSKQRRTA